MREPRRPSAAVLIVEDEPLIRMGAVVLIEDAGFDVYEAGSADAAIALLEVHKEISLIFTDVDMPGSMDGLNQYAMEAQKHSKAAAQPAMTPTRKAHSRSIDNLSHPAKTVPRLNYENADRLSAEGAR